MNWNISKQSIFSIILMICLSVIGMQDLKAAQQGYVVDLAYLQIRRGPGNEYAIVKSLPNGSKITILNDNIGGGYAEVELENGIKGYALNRYLAEAPKIPKPDIKKQPIKKIIKKTIPKKVVKKNSKPLKPSADLVTADALIKERNQLADELQTLRHTVANSLDIERQRNDLQERLVNLERNNRHLKLENQAFQDKSSHDWFLLGAGVLFAGIIIGWVFASLGRRKNSSSWDRF